MDIFLLFIFNIFTGAVIFLILSLKIEKTSSTFQEKKLRREMGEIITEFNATAERNITLLESRISVLKKLLNENGSLKGIDFTVLDDKMKNNTIKSPNIDIKEESIIEKRIDKENKNDKIDAKFNNSGEQHNIIGNFMDKIQSFNRSENNSIIKEKKKTSAYENKKEIEMPHESFSIKEKEVNNAYLKSTHIDFSADEEITLSYEDQEPVDIEEMFNTTDDKYLLIAQLFNEGHSVEELSKHSGLPAGEIKLVISLNS